MANPNVTSPNHSPLTYARRFAAQEPLFGARGTAALRQARLFIAASGGLGFNIAQAACRAGFQTIYQADAQVTEEDNLNRIVAATRHIGQSKVLVLQELLLTFDRMADDKDFEFVPLVYPVEHPAVRDCLNKATHIISCPNSAESRLWLLRYAKENAKPLFNVGFSCRPQRFIRGEISVYRPSIGNRNELGCPACLGLRPSAAPSGPLFYPPLLVLSGLTIHLLAAEVSDFDGHGSDRPNLIVFDGFAHSISAFQVPPDPACAICRR